MRFLPKAAWPLILCLPIVAASAQTTGDSASDKDVGAVRRIVSSISLSGFGTVTGLAHSVPGKNYELTALEVDGAVEFASFLQGAFAIVRDGNRAAIGVGILDLHLGGGRIAPRGAIFAEQGIHFQVGRFDLPYGSDWQRYAAPDRGLGTAPLATDDINDGGMNDIGARLFAVHADWNATVYGVKGAIGGRALGARIGITPFSNPFTFSGPSVERPFEVGVSAHVDARDGIAVDQRGAIDATIKSSFIDIVAEYDRRRVISEIGGTPIGTSNGWHAGVEVPWKAPAFVSGLVLGRIEQVSGADLWDGSTDWVVGRRAIGGIRFDFGDYLAIKAEHHWLVGSGSTLGLPVRAWYLNAVVKKW